MGGIAEAVQIHHRHGLNRAFPQHEGDRAHPFLVERHEHVAVAGHAFGDVEAQIPRHQRVGHLQIQIVIVVTNLGRHLQRVAEARRGQQGDARALALDQRVGDERGRVDGDVDIGPADRGVGQQRGHALLHATRGIVRRGQALAQGHRAGFVHQNEIGEGAADIEAEAMGGGHSPSS